MSNKKFEIMQMQSQLEKELEWDKWIEEIPFIELPKKYKIKIIPPFNWAIVRFLVKYKSKEVSIYLDCYDFLGWFGEPYWEVFPDIDGDVFRCKMKDVETLQSQIKLILEKQEEAHNEKEKSE